MFHMQTRLRHPAGPLPLRRDGPRDDGDGGGQRQTLQGHGLLGTKHAQVRLKR